MMEYRPDTREPTLRRRGPQRRPPISQASGEHHGLLFSKCGILSVYAISSGPHRTSIAGCAPERDRATARFLGDRGGQRFGAPPQPDDSVLEPRVAPLEHRLARAVSGEIVVVPELTEARPDGPSRRPAKEVGERGRLGSPVVAAIAQGPRPHDHGRHREELHRHVDESEEKRLPTLQRGAVDEHPVEDCARQPGARPPDEPQVAGEYAEAPESGPPAPRQP